MIIAANFKTNHTRASTKEYIDGLNEYLKSEKILDEVMVFPPYTALDSFDSSSNLTIGAQNAYPVKSGSFTGEIGEEQLNEFDIKLILIGHSERRHILGESQEFTAKKYAYFMEQGYRIVYCIGEPKEVREEGIDEVIAYNLSQLEGIDLSYENLIIAYEPVWAIGTGLSATTEQIEETLSRLKEKIKAPLLYGGSVKPANTKEILSIKNCDGILVGTASWDLESFKQMISISKELEK